MSIGKLKNVEFFCLEILVFFAFAPSRAVLMEVAAWGFVLVFAIDERTPVARDENLVFAELVFDLLDAFVQTICVGVEERKLLKMVDFLQRRNAHSHSPHKQRIVPKAVQKAHGLAFNLFFCAHGRGNAAGVMKSSKIRRFDGN